MTSFCQAGRRIFWLDLTDNRRTRCGRYLLIPRQPHPKACPALSSVYYLWIFYSFNCIWKRCTILFPIVFPSGHSESSLKFPRGPGTISQQTTAIKQPLNFKQKPIMTLSTISLRKCVTSPQSKVYRQSGNSEARPAGETLPCVFSWPHHQELQTRKTQAGHIGPKTRHLCIQYVVGTIINKMNITLHWRRHKTSDWDHNLIRKLSTEVINQMGTRVNFLMSSLDFFFETSEVVVPDSERNAPPHIQNLNAPSMFYTIKGADAI